MDSPCKTDKLIKNNFLQLTININSGCIDELIYKKIPLIKVRPIQKNNGDIVFFAHKVPGSQTGIDYRFVHTKSIVEHPCQSMRIGNLKNKECFEMTQGKQTHIVTISGNNVIEIEKHYTLTSDSSLIKIESYLRNISNKTMEIDSVVMGLDGIRIGNDWSDECIHPVDYEEKYDRAYFKEMKDKYYHSTSSPTGLTLPYIMAYNAKLETGIWYSHWADKGALEFHISADKENRTGTLAARVGLYKVFLPGEKYYLGETYIRIFEGSHYDGMKDFLKWITVEKKVLVPKDTPKFADDLIFGDICDVDFYKYGRSFKGLCKRLHEYKEFGINAIMMAGLWYSTEYNSKYKGTFKVHCCLIPKNGLFEPEPVYGGREGLREFLNTAHALGMKVIPWISTSGLAWEAEEVTKYPDWWVYKKEPFPNKLIGKNASYTQWLKLKVQARPDEYLDFGYGELSLGNGFSPGYREFILKNAKNIKKLGFDGIFYDSLMVLSPNYRNYPWYGECYRSYVDMARYIREEMKKIDKDFIFMGECKGWEAAQYVDFCGLRYRTAPPKMPAYTNKNFKPEYIQDLARMDSLSRLPGQKTYTAEGFIRDGFVSEEPQEERLSWAAYALLSNNSLRVWPYHARENGEKVHKYPWGWIQDKEELTQLEIKFWNMIKKLVKIRKENTALRKGYEEFEGIKTDTPGILMFVRIYKQERILCVINFNGDAKDLIIKIYDPKKLNLGKKDEYQLRDLYNEQNKTQIVNNQLLEQGVNFQIAPYGVKVLKIV